MHMTATGTDESTRTSPDQPPRDGEDLGKFWPEEHRWSGFGARLKHISVQPESIITLVVVAAIVAFTFKELQPSLLFKNTTPSGGDMGAHVFLPWYIKTSLLPHLRLTGWTPDWYNGFPALTYYFPGPMVAIALLSYIIPYDIAFKLVTVFGLLTLPIAAWAFGKLARMRFPGPVCLAAATLPYLFTERWTIYGGNIASTMAGEFCFSISLSFALLFLGFVMRGLDNGRHRAIAALILACCGISHILPLFFAIGGAVVLTVMAIDWRNLASAKKPLLWSVSVLVTAGCLIAFWALPFELRLPYATNMGYQKITTYMGTLFPEHDLWIFLFAGVGVIMSAFRRNRVGLFFGVMAVLSAVVFCIAPPGRLWNARVIPFWYLCLYLLVGVAFLEVGSAVIRATRRVDLRREMGIGLALFTGLVAFVWVCYPLHDLPGGHESASGTYSWLGIKTTDSSFVPSWVNWNYSGYQSSGKTREKEYFALIDEMRTIGQQYGCGQAMWEYEPELNEMGTPDALMLLPYWTSGCIGSEEGLYYESSATTPYHFLNDAELSDQPPDPVRGLNYPSAPDVIEGVEHMQMLGDKYFMAETPDIEKAANADPSLQLVATVGPYPVTYTTGNTSTVEQRTWDIYKVLDSASVTPLVYQPVVMKGVAAGGQKWLTASEAWYLDPADWQVFEAASGPKNWARVTSTTSSLPRTPLPPIQVTNIHEGTQSISFNVSQTGVPVLVKTSYFPNWQASGASAVYRVTPNLMVVIPTSTHVTLNYGYTALDWIGFILSLLGLLSLAFLWWLPRVDFPADRFFLAPLDPDWDEGGGSAAWAAKVHGRVPPSTPSPFDPAVLDAIFKAYDIRGTVPDQMNPDLARAVGAAFARFTGAERIVVARDMRPSGVDLTAAFAQGALAAGVNVIDLGLTSTDELYFASGSLNAPGAMFTASHNPAQYNGIKLCLAGARPVGADTGLREIKNSLTSASYQAPSATVGTMAQMDVLEDYATKVRSFVTLDSLRPLKVVADTANGMGGLVVPAVFSTLPFQLEILFGELDGTFPNHPADPIQPENLEALRNRILETGADVGLAFDGDADRCFLVDDQGQPVSGSTTTALVAAAMLERNPGAVILHNLICSKAVPEIVRERGGVPVRTRVGHSYIKAIMADTDALFGGEHSGHYYFRDNYRADSGTIAALVVLEVLSKTDRPLSDLRRDYERYADSGEINTEVPDPLAVIDAVGRHYEYGIDDGPAPRQDRLDGLTVDFGDWWFNLRPSNTEPLLRLNLEAADRQACDARTAELLSLIRNGGPEGEPDRPPS
jgi:phosphomannomutase